MSLRDYLKSSCEVIDAGVFSGDVLYCDNERKELKEYVERWSKAIAEHESADLCNVAPTKVPAKVAKAETTFKPIPKYGDHMTLEKFKEHCSCGGFIDYDGHGDLATSSQISNKEISPSDVARGYAFPEWCTHIVWFNR